MTKQTDYISTAGITAGKRFAGSRRVQNKVRKK